MVRAGSDKVNRAEGLARVDLLGEVSSRFGLTGKVPL